MASTEVATQGLTDDELAVIMAQQAEDDSAAESYTNVPLLKVTQPLTKEVNEGDAEPGQFLNSSLGMSLGNEVEFIVAYYQKGRFYAPKGKKAVSAVGTDIIPEHWEETIGAEFVGTRFDEHPDAEEQYKARVNAGEIEWGSGPPLATTYNFTGLALVKDEEGEYQVHPVRLSLKRGDTENANKIRELKRMMFNKKPYWAKVYNLKTERKSYTQGAAFVTRPSLGRNTTPEEQQMASQLAAAVVQGRINVEEEGNDAPVKPKSTGGIGV